MEKYNIFVIFTNLHYNIYKTYFEGSIEDES